MLFALGPPKSGTTAIYLGSVLWTTAGLLRDSWPEFFEDLE
jgi:hypothetical protein